MPKRAEVEERGFQFSFGGEFGINPPIDEFCQKVLGLLPDLNLYQPLAIVTSLDLEDSGTVSSLAIRTGGGKRIASVISGLPSFQEYCRNNKIRGMIVLTPELRLGKISPEAFGSFQEFFGGIGKVANPDKYRVWFVEKEVVADFPVKPKTEAGKKALTKKIQFVQEMGLAGVKYRHDQSERIGWFEARLPKKRQVKERDVSQDERIIFLKRWAEMVAEFWGAKVISTQALEDKLKHSHSYVVSMQEAGDLNGVVLDESCGCRVELKNGDAETVILSCGQENCFREFSKDSKKPFKLGEKYSTSPCGDCGGERIAKAYWAGVFDPAKGIRVYYEISCKEYSSHNLKDWVWADPVRILNPL